MSELQATLNRLAGTSGLDAQGAANVIAGTQGLDLVGALNAKAGTDGLELNGVCRSLASQHGGNARLDAPGALASIESIGSFDGMGATLWLDATDLGEGWEPADGLPNSGTEGSALDFTLAGDGLQKNTLTYIDTLSAITVVEGGLEIAAEDADCAGDDDFEVAASFVGPVGCIPLDTGESGMVTMDFTILWAGAGTMKYADLYTGASIPKIANPDPAVARGAVIEWFDDAGGGPGSGGFGVFFNDNTLPFGSGVPVFPRPEVGTRLRVSARWDRDAGEYTEWIDGELWQSAVDIADLTASGGSGALGSLLSAEPPAICNQLTLHHFMFHPDGTDGFGDPAALHAALGVS